MKPTKVWHFFHLFFILFAVSFYRSVVKTYHSFDFAFHIMSQLVPQMKEEIPQLSEIPQWDSIRILAVQSSGLFLFKLAGIHRITEYFRLGEEFIWSSTPAQGGGSSCGRSGCLGICPPEIWISLTMKFPQPVGEVVSQHPHSDSFLPHIPSGLPLLGSSQPCILAGLLPPRWCVPLEVVAHRAGVCSGKDGIHHTFCCLHRECWLLMPISLWLISGLCQLQFCISKSLAKEGPRLGTQEQ